MLRWCKFSGSTFTSFPHLNRQFKPLNHRLTQKADLHHEAGYHGSGPHSQRDLMFPRLAGRLPERSVVLVDEILFRAGAGRDFEFTDEFLPRRSGFRGLSRERVKAACKQNVISVYLNGRYGIVYPEPYSSPIPYSNVRHLLNGGTEGISY